MFDLRRVWWLAWGAAAFGALGACRKDKPSSAAVAEPPATSAATTAALEPSAGQVVLAYSSEKKTWLEEQIALFNGTHPKLPNGASFSVVGKAMGSGEAMQDILGGRLHAAVYSPASEAYLSLMNEAWLHQPGHTKALAAHSDSVVISPMVIAMWQPMAEALGWPKKSIGWADILSISRNEQGWAAFKRPEWGKFKLGHTHPEYSNSGLLAVLAEAYAGAGKTRELDETDVSSAKTRAFLTGIEKSIVHYGKSTGFFSEKMLTRGPSYLSAAVLYENLVIESYANPSSSGMKLVSIYPREGTFWSDHPYAVLDGDWVSPDQKQGAQEFLAFLKARPAQERALALGLRPADPSVAVSAPVDAEHGCDPKQPQTLLSVPTAATMQKLLEVFHEIKKPSDVTLVFDKSGSMRGEPMNQARAGAKAFIEALDARDDAGIEFFDSELYPTVGPFKVEGGRAQLLQRVSEVNADGGTALYDAVDAAYRAALTRANADHDRIHALVVMTDGKDENSKLDLEALTREFPPQEQGSSVKVFTIAYGSAASSTVLSQIAEAGDGSHSVGDVDNIVQVYRDIASFF